MFVVSDVSPSADVAGARRGGGGTEKDGGRDVKLTVESHRGGRQAGDTAHKTWTTMMEEGVNR